MTGIALLLPVTLSVMAIVLLTPSLPQILREFSGVAGHDYWVPMLLTVPAPCIALLSLVAGMLGGVMLAARRIRRGGDDGAMPVPAHG